MISKNITYVNFDNEEVTETFFFNMTKAELVEMEIEANGTMVDRLTKISESDDVKVIYATFKEIILNAYGEKSSDGKRFLKSKEISEAFSQTEAYSELLFEMMTADKAAEFINALMPKGLSEMVKNDPRAASLAAMQGHNKPQTKSKNIEQVPDLPAAEPVLEPKPLSDREIRELTREQLEEHIRMQSFLK